MNQCIFCRIVERSSPARIVFEDDEIVAFEDARPQAPVHILIVPRKHLASLKDATAKTLLSSAGCSWSQRNWRGSGFTTRGYRTVFDTGSGVGQTVFHLHLHLLGGRAFHWPPG